MNIWKNANNCKIHANQLLSAAHKSTVEEMQKNGIDCLLTLCTEEE